MWNPSRHAVAIVVSTIGSTIVGLGSALAADIPQARPYGDYYGDVPLVEGRVYAPAPVYRPLPPPVYYYEYDRPPVAVVPGPYYYGRRYYGPGYGPYVARRYGGYGYYGRYRRW